MNLLLRKKGHGLEACRGIQELSLSGIVQRKSGQKLAGPVEVLFRWGCFDKVSAKLEVNTPSMLTWMSDKRRSRMEMQAAKVNVPESWSVDSRHNTTPQSEPSAGQFVSRPSAHAQGARLVVGSFAQCVRQSAQWGGGYVSRLINKTSEYRVFVVSGRVAWVARKTPGNPQDVAWNVAQGGRFDNVRFKEWPLAVCKEALKAAAVGNIDFGGVDVMLDNSGKAYVLEINGAVAMESPYRTQCTAACFDYIVKNGKKQFPMPDRIKGYGTIIHPAVAKREE